MAATNAMEMETDTFCFVDMGFSIFYGLDIFLQYYAAISTYLEL